MNIKTMKPIVVASLFDGMSCAQLALRERGIPVKTYFASEIDKWAIAVTRKNFPQTKFMQIRNIKSMIGIIWAIKCQSTLLKNQRTLMWGKGIRLIHWFPRHWHELCTRDTELFKTRMWVRIISHLIKVTYAN